MTTRNKVVLCSTIILLALSIYFLIPTFHFYRLPLADRAQLEKDRDPIIGKTLNLGLDLRGGIHLLLELDRSKMDPKMNVNDALERAIEIIRTRVDKFGVAEPLITKYGDHWIIVELPGVKDPDQAKDLIGKTALLEFKLVEESGAMSDLYKALSGKKMTMDQFYDLEQQNKVPPDLQKAVPTGYELLKMQGDSHQYILVASTAELTGSTINDARVSFGGGGSSLNMGLPVVEIEFNGEGTQRFAAITEANVGHRFAIVLDGMVFSAPVIKTAIPDGRAEISGDFTADTAKLLATVLKAGALPAPVHVIEERTVGPSLGEDSIKSGVRASLIGVFLVVFFMLVYYRMSGLIADAAMFINMLFIFGVMAYLHATITLPGIAGTILSLAMAVDANVLILERVREELQNGKTPRLAIDLGYRHAWPAIIDGHVTNLISAALLYQFGTGPVKGFAVTLFWGVLISIFTAVFFTHMVYELWFAGEGIPALKFMQLFKRTNFDFIAKRYAAFAFSAVLLLSGIVSLVVKKGPKLGIDFTGGTLVQLGFQQTVPIREVRGLLSEAGYNDAELQDFASEKSVIIRVPKTAESPDALAHHFIDLMKQKIPQAQPLEQPQRAEFVGPAVGHSLAVQAEWAIFLATILIIIYVAIRFRSMLWGVCSIAALVHDVISVVGIFSILNKEITVTVVAGILTLAGYSMNDTIVVYDRMRENVRLSRKESLLEVINRSVNETLSRTIMTSMTVAITVAVFFWTGGSVIHDFSFAMLWGVFVGSYSSIFVAAPIIYEWETRRGKKALAAKSKK